jgi:putative hemolysin
MERAPKTGNKTVFQKWQLEIADMDGKRIDKILAMKVSQS